MAQLPTISSDLNVISIPSPHAALVASGDGTFPAWVQELVDDGSLIEVFKFSKFLTGVAWLHGDKTTVKPGWMGMLEDAVSRASSSSRGAPSVAGLGSGAGVEGISSTKNPLVKSESHDSRKAPPSPAPVKDEYDKDGYPVKPRKAPEATSRGPSAFFPRYPPGLFTNKKQILPIKVNSFHVIYHFSTTMNTYSNHINFPSLLFYILFTLFKLFIF
jgi:hypothetical protein